MQHCGLKRFFYIYDSVFLEKTLHFLHFKKKNFLLYLSTYSASQSDSSKLADPMSIVISKELGMKVHDTVLHIGPFRVTLADLCTVVPPGKLVGDLLKMCLKEIPRFHEGWLADTVSILQYRSGIAFTCVQVKTQAATT